MTWEKIRKSDSSVVPILFEQGNIGEAIKFGNMLLDMHKNKFPSDSYPSTTVHLLVEKLLKYSKYKF